MILGITISIGLYRYIKTKPLSSEWKSLEFLLPFLLLNESLIQFFASSLFHLSYIPFIVVISGYLSLKIVISCISVIFLLGVPTLLWIDGIDSELMLGIYLSILVTGIVSWYIFHRNKKITEKAVKDLEELKSSALDLEASTEGSLFDEDRFSHLVKSILETQKGLKEMLNLIKKATDADSVTFFILEGDNLISKASTEDTPPAPTYAWEGYLLGITKEKKPLIQPKLKGTLFDFGHLSTKGLECFLCVPVLDGDIPVGILVIESKRESAFGEREKDIAVSFSSQIMQTLGKMRSYIEIERFAKGFKALHEASIMLSASLSVEKIAEEFVGLVSGMLTSSAVGFFVADKGKLRVIAKRGFEPEKESFYPRDTFFDLIIKNKQPIHFSHLDKKQGVYPFKISDTKTFLGIPIISESDVLGILAIASKEPDAISSFQDHLLKIVANQTAMCMTNARLHKEVGRLAVTDGLTGLYNHKHFQERLDEEFQRIERIPQSLSLMLIDIDHFKKINDVYGHPAGDTILAALATILRRVLRGIDILARYGGEEFAAVLINTETGGAKKMAERLRSAVINNPFFINENRLTTTLSIGVATYPHDAVTKEELIDKADKALYHAKENGRNQVCAWKDIKS